MDNNIQLELEKLRDEVGKVVRRQDEIQKTVDLLFTDRQILEDVQGSIKHLQEIILQNQEHQDNTKKDLKADVKDIKISMENKVEAVQAIVENAATEIKATVENKDNFIEKLKNKLKGGIK